MPPAAVVLVADADSVVRELLRNALRYQGFVVHTVATGRAAVDRVIALRPDAVILDTDLPGIDGLGVLARIRAQAVDAPVLFLAARTTAHDRIRGLTVGGADYITKPFSVGEVAARLHTVLRSRPPAPAPATRLRFADIELDPDTHEAWKNGKPVSLSSTEFRLLHHFMTNPNKAMSKVEILEHVWPNDFDGNINVVETYIAYLRRKIDTGQPRLLHTLRGVGYILRQPPSPTHLETSAPSAPTRRARATT